MITQGRKVYLSSLALHLLLPNHPLTEEELHAFLNHHARIERGSCA